MKLDTTNVVLADAATFVSHHQFQSRINPTSSQITSSNISININTNIVHLDTVVNSRVISVINLVKVMIS
jgi:hypothetical protein